MPRIKKCKRFVVLMLSCLLFATIIVQAQVRIYSNEFLNIGAGARGLSTGGAQVASVNDVAAGYWNPAGLTQVKDHPSLALMHAEYFAGIGKYDYAALALPVSDNKRTLGISILRFAVDDIPNTLYLIEPDGSINYANISSFSSADWAFILSMAQVIRENDQHRLSVGVNAKVIHRNVGSFARAWGFGLDAGVQLTGSRWSLGVMARDITTTFNTWNFTFTDREKEVLFLTNNEIPVRSTEITAPRLILGGAYNFPVNEKISIKGELNLDLTFDGRRNTLINSNVLNVDPRLGVEGNLKDLFFLRAGIYNFQKVLSETDVNSQRKTWIFQPGAGAGFILNKTFHIDYAFTNLANQSNPLYTHVISLKLDLNKNRMRR
ncbi:MAG: PorV/PorQ family protein [Bacteroidetes bacterium]|nr:PorV/PorQ family protein [Bacteroidota bacterium]